MSSPTLFKIFAHVFPLNENSIIMFLKENHPEVSLRSFVEEASGLCRVCIEHAGGLEWAKLKSYEKQHRTRCIQEMQLEGFSRGQIASAWSISEPRVSQILCSAEPDEQPKRRYFKKQDMAERKRMILAMFNAGKTPREIATRFRVSEARIYQILRIEEEGHATK